MRKAAFLTFCLIISAIFLAGCNGAAGRRDRWHTIDGAVWRTTYHIVYESPLQLDDSVIAVLNNIDRSLSVFNSASIVAAVNRGDTAVRADRMFAEVFAASKQVWEASDGRFDPTLGAAIRLWGFGPGSDTIAPPSQSAIDSVRSLVGLDRCGITPDGRVIRKHPLTEFNFSAIAKGYACDEVAAMLRRNGAENYMVEIGGEIALRGTNSRGKPWRVMIDAPCEGDASGRPVHLRLAEIEADSGGIATSGNYRNFRDVAGQGRVGHTIDPVSCRPVRQQILSATVTAQSAMLADAIATACMTGSASDAARIISRFPGAGCLVVMPDSTVKIFGKFPNLR